MWEAAQVASAAVAQDPTDKNARVAYHGHVKQWIELAKQFYFTPESRSRMPDVPLGSREDDELERLLA